MAARDSGSSVDADARNTEFFMAGLRDGFNGLTKNTPTDRSVADAYDIGFRRRPGRSTRSKVGRRISGPSHGRKPKRPPSTPASRCT